MAADDPGIRQITVVGAGTMGGGIAQVCLTAGLAVTLIDSDTVALTRARDGIGGRLRRLVARGRLAEADAHAAEQRLTLAGDLTAAGGEVVIEAIIEDLAAKSAVLAALDGLCPPPAVLASNTSSLSITRLAAATAHPGRVIGLHFFNPAPVMALLEVVRGLATSEATVALALALGARLGKTPVLVNDAPGFVGNRVVLLAINEAIYALMEGVATAEDIDRVLTLGFNHPMGPLALADLIGLDVVLAALEAMHQGFGDDKYRPCPLLRRQVAAGWLGRKTGRGFFSYADPAAGSG